MEERLTANRTLLLLDLPRDCLLATMTYLSVGEALVLLRTCRSLYYAERCWQWLCTHHYGAGSTRADLYGHVRRGGCLDLGGNRFLQRHRRLNCSLAADEMRSSYNAGYV
jgi:hypothetical protein